MDLNGLLQVKCIDPRHVLVFRHRPQEAELNKFLPWLAAEKPDLFNAYQAIQGERLEGVMQAMVGSGYVASFIGREAGKALFVGLYSIVAAHTISEQDFWRIPACIELRALGMRTAWSPARASGLWFQLVLTDFYAHWKGRLVVGWPPPERTWWRRAHNNEMPVLFVSEDSQLDPQMPQWDEIELTWDALRILPNRYRSALSEWRGIYFIFDVSAQKGYVGAAYGAGNLLDRWKNYASEGHGGNRLLRDRDPTQFRFTILERVSPDMDPADVIRLEASWKRRLHTRTPHGLNDN